MISDTKTTKTSERIAKLKSIILSVPSTICTERAGYFTEVYKEFEGSPIILKRAYALEKTLKKMTIFISDGELIVGNQSSRLRAAPIFPEYVTSWILNELDEFDKRPGDAFFINDRQKDELKRICNWWEGKTLIDKGYSLMSEVNRQIHDSGIIRAEGNLTSGDAHIAVNFEKILSVGLKGYLFNIEANQNKLNDSDPRFFEQQDFYNALII